MIDLKQYNELKKKVDRLQRDADRAQGALDKLMDELKDEFSCGTLEEAEKMLAGLEKKAEKAERDYVRKLAAFEEKWSEVLGEGETG